MMHTPDILILGIDGVPYSLLYSLAEQEVMPNVWELLQHGKSKPMLSSIPDVSSTAWTSFMTGVNPGTHGIYGFFELKKADYGLWFLTSGDIRVSTIWDYLDKHQKKSLIINIPQTYPAREINGILISGFVAPKLNRAVYPEFLYPELKKIDYRIDVDTWLARKNPDKFFDELFRVIEQRKIAVDYLWSKENWDFITVVFTSTDRLQHYFWDAILDEHHEYHAIVMDFYHELDSLLGDILEKVQKETMVCLISDHGFTKVEREVNLNAYFRERGLLLFEKNSPASLEDMNAKSSVFALDPGRIYLNRSARYTKGWITEDEETERILSDIKLLLEQELIIRDQEGNRVNPISHVYLPEEIYSGPALDDAPDLIAVPKDGFDFKGNVRIQDVYRTERLTGVHTRNNASFVVLNQRPNFDFTSIETIEDIVPEIKKSYQL